MSEWPTVRLGDVCSKPQYGAIACGSNQAVGPRFVRQTDLRDGRIDWSTVPYCDLDASNHGNFALATDDLLVARLGSVGRAARVREPMGAVYAGYLVRFRADRSRALPAFLGYQLQAPSWWEYVEAVRSGAVQPTLNAKQMAAYSFALPPPPVQRAIAEVLGALDDKIEANRRLVELCDTTWATAVNGEADGVPTPLSSLARFVNGRAFTKGASGSGRMVVRIAELNAGPGGSTVYNDIPVEGENLARPGDLLFAWSGSLTARRWFRSEAIINQHIFKVIPKEGVPVWFVHAAILQLLDLFRGIAADKATTMGHIQRHHLDEQIVVPSNERLHDLDGWCGPLWRRALLAEQENVILAALRDTLLPKLLSGELRVRDAEPVVSEAV